MRRLAIAAVVAVAAGVPVSSAGSAAPDAGRIAFASDYPLSPTHHPQVLAVGAGGRHNLGGDAGFAYSYPALSPDRSQVAFVRYAPARSELWIVGVDGNGRRRLLAAPPGKSFGRVAWSPRGKLLAVGLGDGDVGFEEVWLARTKESGGSPTVTFREGPYKSLGWSPRGDRLALERVSYAGCRPGSDKWCASSHIEVVRADAVRLVVFESARNLAWSPDGTRVAFERGDFTEIGQADAVISIARTDGSPVRTVSSPWPDGSCSRFPRWSPDGRWVSYLLEIRCDSSNVVRVFVRAGGAWKDWRLPGTYARWSPGGSRVLSVEVVSGRRALYVSRADGRGRRLVATGIVEAGWSPTGALYWLESIRRHAVLFRASATGLGALQLTSVDGDASFPVFAKRRRRLAVTVAKAGSTRIFRNDESSVRLVFVAREPAGSEVTPIGWSRDARTVLYLAQDQTRRDFEIWTTRPDGSDARRMTTNERDDLSPVWSPDGTRIAFVRDVRDGYTPGYPPRLAILTIGANGGDERQLALETGDVDDLTWSPDGTKVAYGAGGWVNVANVDGSGTRRLARGKSPTWSPDGSELAFDEGVAGMASLRIIRADGTGERTIRRTFGANAVPAWSPDGTQIAFNEGTALRVIRPDGTGERTLLGGVWATTIRWSPDSTKIAFAQQPCCGTTEQGVFVINADGSDRHRVASLPAQPSWSPDGTRLAFNSFGAPAGFFSRLYVVDSDGAKLTPITTASASSDRPSWSPVR